MNKDNGTYNNILDRQITDSQLCILSAMFCQIHSMSDIHLLRFEVNDTEYNIQDLYNILDDIINDSEHGLNALIVRSSFGDMKLILNYIIKNVNDRMKQETTSTLSEVIEDEVAKYFSSLVPNTEDYIYAPIEVGFEVEIRKNGYV